MQHDISITVINNTIGVPQETSGIMGLFMKAVAVASTFALNTGYLLTQLSDLVDLGIDAAYDVTNSTAVYQQVSEYYQQAGDGALLWIFGVDKASAFADFVVSDVFKALIRFTAQDDPLNRVKMIGLCYDVPTTTQTATDFPADVTATIPALETARVALFAEGYQFSAILDGYRMSASVSVAALGTMATKSAPGVSLCITGTKGNGVSAVGMGLGRFARISIGHGVGAVDDGPMVAADAFLTNSVLLTSAGLLIVGKIYTVFGGAITYNAVTYNIGDVFTAVTGHTSFTTAANGYVIENSTRVATLTPTNIDQLGQKQFFFLRTWFSKSGYFWNDGATCELATKPLSTQEYNRVANQLSADALSFFINEMGKNLPLDANTGAVDQGYLNTKQQEYTDAYITPLATNTGTGDISGGSIVVTGPNFNATKTLNFKLKILPTPILGSVEGTVEFVSSL